MLHLKRKILITLALLALSTTASALPGNDSCGIGTIQRVIIGGWNWEGLHVVIDYDAGQTPTSSSLYSGGTVRFLKADLADDRFKALYAATLLAYANGMKVNIKSTYNNSLGETDCKRATEMTLLP